MSAAGGAWTSGSNTEFTTHLLRRCAKLLPPDWRLFWSSGVPDESVVERHGTIEIRHVPTGFAAETCVKGDPDAARETALRRLANYLGGANRSGRRLRSHRPVTQRPDAPGRWRARISLPGVTSELAAAVARNGKIRIRAVAPETLAVVRLAGRPSYRLLGQGEAMILATIAATAWVPIGAAMIRLHTPPRRRILGGWFEVALPVSALRDRLAQPTLTDPTA
jgi:SOUL heme-binding protein